MACSLFAYALGSSQEVVYSALFSMLYALFSSDFFEVSVILLLGSSPWWWCRYSHSSLSQGDGALFSFSVGGWHYITLLSSLLYGINYMFWVFQGSALKSTS